MNKSGKVISWLLVITWMAIIFYLSHQPATESSELSGGITEVIIRIAETITSPFEVNIEVLNHIVRKGAHFFAYFILGLLVMNKLRWYKIHGYQRIVLSFIITVLYAISDEVHQLFIPGRSGEAIDVLIDGAGASVGIMLYWIFCLYINRGK